MNWAYSEIVTLMCELAGSKASSIILGALNEIGEAVRDEKKISMVQQGFLFCFFAFIVNKTQFHLSPLRLSSFSKSST